MSDDITALLNCETWQNDGALLKATSKADAEHTFQRFKAVFPETQAFTPTEAPAPPSARRRVMFGVPLAAVALWIVGGIVAVVVTAVVGAFFKSADGTTYTSGKMIQLIGSGDNGRIIAIIFAGFSGGGLGGYVAFRILDGLARSARNNSNKLLLRAMLAVIAIYGIAAYFFAFFAFPTWELRIAVPTTLLIGSAFSLMVFDDKFRYFLCPKCNQYIGSRLVKSLSIEGVLSVEQALDAEPTQAALAGLLREHAKNCRGSVSCRICPTCGEGLVETDIILLASWGDRPEDSTSASWKVRSQWMPSTVARPLRRALEVIHAEEVAKRQGNNA